MPDKLSIEPTVQVELTDKRRKYQQPILYRLPNTLNIEGAVTSKLNEGSHGMVATGS